MNSFTFAGKNSYTDFGCAIETSKTWAMPVRDVTHIKVPGRNGDVLLDNGRWDNVTVTYRIGVGEGVDEQTATSRYNALRAFLCQQVGYQQLSDTAHPDEYRMASFEGGIQPSVTIYEGRQGHIDMDVSFSCKPQRYVSAGSTKPENIQFPNETGFTAYPLLLITPPTSFVEEGDEIGFFSMMRFTSAGNTEVSTFYVYNYFPSDVDELWIDSETHEVYYYEASDTEHRWKINASNWVDMVFVQPYENGNFPIIHPAEYPSDKYAYTWSSGSSGSELYFYPRWCVI